MVKMKLSMLILAITFVGSALSAKKYFLSEDTKNWWKALDSCMSQGMVLASISSKEDEDQLVKQIKDANATDSYWIGGTNFGASNSKESHYWLGLNKLLSHTNWHKGEPSSPDSEHCLQLRKQFNWQWNDGNCDKAFFYACEEIDKSESDSPEVSSRSISHSSSSSDGCELQNSLPKGVQGSESTVENGQTFPISPEPGAASSSGSVSSSGSGSSFGSGIGPGFTTDGSEMDGLHSESTFISIDNPRPIINPLSILNQLPTLELTPMPIIESSPVPTVTTLVV